MKILFTAFFLLVCLGGHTRSMYQVKELMASNGHDCEVLLIGSSNEPHEFHSAEHYIDLRKTGFSKIKKLLGRIYSQFKPDLIHSFDDYSYLLTQLTHSIPKLLTKCRPQSKELSFCSTYDTFQYREPRVL